MHKGKGTGGLDGRQQGGGDLVKTSVRFSNGVNTAEAFLFNYPEALCIDLICPCKSVYPAHWTKQVLL